MPTSHSSQWQASVEGQVGDHQGPVDAMQPAQPRYPNQQIPEVVALVAHVPAAPHLLSFSYIL